MADDVTLEIQDGETLEDAIKRLAAATQPDKPKKAPKKSAKHKPIETVPADPTPAVEAPIYAAFHMYLLPDRTIEKLRSDAARERKMYGPGVQVFLHAHQPGEKCADQCAERVE